MTISQLPPTRTARPGGWLWWPVTFATVAWIAPQILAGLPLWTAPVAGAVVAGAGIGLARYQWPIEVYGVAYLRGAIAFALATGVLLAGWLLACQLAGGPITLWRWFAYGLAAMALWYFVLAWRAPHWAASVERRVVGAQVAERVEQLETGGVYAGILRAAGVIPGAAITRVERSETGGMDTVHLVPAAAAGGRKRMTYNGLVARLADIITEADLALPGIDLTEDDVIPEMVSAASWRLSFTVRRVLADPVPYPIRTEPRDVDEPGCYGRFENDTAIRIALTSCTVGTSHIDLLAGTGGGKTVGINGQIAEDLAPDRWEVWVFATRKLVPLVWPWLRPWVAGETDRPALDRVIGEDMREVLAGMAEALQLVTAWNQQLGAADVRSVRPGDGGLTLVFDEASTSLSNPLPITFTLNGQSVTMTASDMFGELSRLARSAQVKLIRAFQDGLFGSGGAAGQIARRNVLAAIVGKVARQQDASAFMPAMPAGIKCTRLRDNAVYVQPNLEEPTILRGKLWALYAKEATGGRPAVDHIRPVVLAYTRWRHGLNPAVTARLATYADRWSPARLPQLVAVAQAEGYTWPTERATPDQPEATPPVTPAATSTASGAAGSATSTAGGLTPDQHDRMILALRILGQQQDEGDRFVREYLAGTLDPTSEHIARSAVGLPPAAANTETGSATPPSTTTTPEATMPANLPDGWDNDGFDVWAAFTAADQDQDQAGGDQAGEQPATTDQPVAAPGTPASVIAAADTSGIAAALARQAEQEAYLARLGGVPEPLRTVLLQMLHPAAQKVVATGWVPTAVLAAALGRCRLEDPASIRNPAVAQLGLELARVTGLRAREIPRPAGLGRVSGWNVDELRAAGERLMQDQRS